MARRNRPGSCHCHLTDVVRWSARERLDGNVNHFDGVIGGGVVDDPDVGTGSVPVAAGRASRHARVNADVFQLTMAIETSTGEASFITLLRARQHAGRMPGRRLQGLCGGAFPCSASHEMRREPPGVAARCRSAAVGSVRLQTLPSSASHRIAASPATSGGMAPRLDAMIGVRAVMASSSGRPNPSVTMETQTPTRFCRGS